MMSANGTKKPNGEPPQAGANGRKQTGAGGEPPRASVSGSLFGAP